MKNLRLAKENLKDGVTLSLVNGCEALTFGTRGVKSLLDLFDTGRDFSSFSAADRVVGLGAAYLYLALGIKRIYAVVISEVALSFLTENSVYVEYDTLVPHIINRRGDGICPIEECVKDATNIDSAIVFIRERLKELLGEDTK